MKPLSILVILIILSLIPSCSKKDPQDSDSREDVADSSQNTIKSDRRNDEPAANQMADRATDTKPDETADTKTGVLDWKGVYLPI